MEPKTVEAVIRSGCLVALFVAFSVIAASCVRDVRGTELSYVIRDACSEDVCVMRLIATDRGRQFKSQPFPLSFPKIARVGATEEFFVPEVGKSYGVSGPNYAVFVTVYSQVINGTPLVVAIQNVGRGPKKRAHLVLALFENELHTLLVLEENVGRESIEIELAPTTNRVLVTRTTPQQGSKARAYKLDSNGPLLRLVEEP